MSMPLYGVPYIRVIELLAAAAIVESAIGYRRVLRLRRYLEILDRLGRAEISLTL